MILRTLGKEMVLLVVSSRDLEGSRTNDIIRWTVVAHRINSLTEVKTVMGISEVARV